MPDPSPTPKMRRRPIPSLCLVWLLLYFAARLLLEKVQFSTGVRIGIALAPIPVFAAFL